MKKYMIRVNGKAYDVEVEEIKSGVSPHSEPSISQVPVQAPMPPPSPVPAPMAPAPSQPPSAAGDNIIAPMPGVVLKLNVKPGDTVKQGDVLMNLEAMKMENEIFAPCDGNVVSVHVTVGESVNAGDPLIDLE